jgi:hypothetical protein
MKRERKERGNNKSLPPKVFHPHHNLTSWCAGFHDGCATHKLELGSLKPSRNTPLIWRPNPPMMCGPRHWVRLTRERSANEGGVRMPLKVAWRSYWANEAERYFQCEKEKCAVLSRYWSEFWKFKFELILPGSWWTLLSQLETQIRWNLASVQIRTVIRVRTISLSLISDSLKVMP